MCYSNGKIDNSIITERERKRGKIFQFEMNNTSQSLIQIVLKIVRIKSLHSVWQMVSIFPKNFFLG